MNERDHVAKELLSLIGHTGEFEYYENERMHVQWQKAGRPLLAPSTKAILEAVEEAMRKCEECIHRNDPNPCNLGYGHICALASIRRAAKGE